MVGAQKHELWRLHILYDIRIVVASLAISWHIRD